MLLSAGTRCSNELCGTLTLVESLDASFTICGFMWEVDAFMAHLNVCPELKVCCQSAECGVAVKSQRLGRIRIHGFLSCLYLHMLEIILSDC